MRRVNTMELEETFLQASARYDALDMPALHSPLDPKDHDT